MKQTKQAFALILALVLCLTAFPLVSFAGYDTASAHVNSLPVPEFTFTGEYAEYGQIAVGDPFDLRLGWTTYTGDAPQPVGEIKEIALVAAADPTSVYILYKNGAAYYGATATVNGNDAVLKNVDSTSIQPGSYFTYITAMDDGGVNTMRSTTLQAFTMKIPEGPGGHGGGELGFTVEPYFFKDGDLNETVDSIPIGSEFALSVYVGEPQDVLLIELVGDGEPLREYALYEDGQVFYGGKIDNEAEGPGWMTGFSSAEFEPGDYYLKVATKNGADGTHEPCITFTGESHAKTGPSIGTKTLPDAKEGEAYSVTLKAQAKYGGSITWSYTGALPTGLSLNAKTGVLSGTPKIGGTFNFVVKATEAGGGSSTASLSVVVKSVPQYTVSYFLNGGKAAVGADYNAKSFKEGNEVTLPVAPSKSGYKFVYWVHNGTAYLPGTVLSVQNDMSFSAEYTVRAPMKVTVPDALKDAVGSLWLTGTDAKGDVYWLWSDWNPKTLDVEVPQYNLMDKTFTKLELRGYVDDVPGIVLASYTGTVTEETERVTLTASALKWQTVRGVEVTGVPETAYYAGDLRVEKNDGGFQYFRPPFMTAGQTFKVSLSARGNTEAAAQYDLEGEYTSTTVKNGKLVITPLKLTDSASVTISAELDGDGYYGTVTASQTVGGYTRTVSGYHHAGRPFTLHLYPGIETRFNLYGMDGKSYLFEGATLASPKDGAAHTIKARTMTLDTRITIDTDLDPALVARYLNKGGRFDFSVTPKGKTNEVNNLPEWFNMQPDLTRRIRTRLYDVSPNAAVTATYTSACTFPASADTTLKEGEGAAHITAKLKPGVVASLAAEVTSSCFFAWFDSAGKYLGSSDQFYLTAWERDVCSVCPTEKAGSYTVALLPTTFYNEKYLSGKDLSGLKEQIVVSWPVTLAANGVQELAPERMDAAVSENVAFVTKPYSTLQASAESFSDVTDVLGFSGTIGLDPGLENGKLTHLGISVKNNGLSATVSSVTINGADYPLSDPQWSNDAGSYYLMLKEPVDLPCTYSIYASPYSASKDVEIEVCADVSYTAFNVSRIATFQKVGDATVKRPGAHISVASTYVCADTALVTGTAKPNETVDVYDNGALVANAAVDWTGAWTANVPLYGIDDTYTTVHELWAESASGVVSNTATVIHRKNGPQLLSLNLVLNNIEQTGTYFYASAMQFANSVKYRLTFANPGELAPMQAWNNAKAVVKVYMGSGNILFVEAQPQTDGSFVADLGNLHGGYIDGVEAIYIPKDGPEAMTQNQDESFSLTATDEEARQMADALSEMRGLLTTDKDGKLVFAGLTEAKAFSVKFDDNDKAAVAGGLTATAGADNIKAIETAMNAAQKEFGEAGLRYKELSSGIRSGKNILEWLNETGAAKAAENKKKGDDARFSYSYRSQIFSTKESFDNTKTYLARYATDAKFSENAAGGNHAHYVFGKNTAADIYTITDCKFDEDGSYLSGTYRITAELLADTAAAPAIYAASVTVELSPTFRGFSWLKAQAPVKKLANALSIFAVRASAADVDVSGLYGITFDGKYHDDPGYEQSGTLETLAGDATNGTGFVSGFIGNSTSFVSKGMQNFGTGMGIVNLGTSIYHLKKTWDNADYRIGQEVRMRFDLQHLIESTCYKRLTESKRQLVDEAMKKYEKAEKNYDNWDGWSTGLSLGLDVCGCICGAFSSFPGGEEFGAAGFGLTGLSMAHGATLGKGANKAYQKMINQYEESYRTIKSIFSSHAQQTGLDDCKKLKKDESNNKTYQINHDPSGIVYEGVIENPVKGATVTLWYGVDANGRLVLEKDAKNVKKVVPAAEVKKSPEETVQVTGADGKYAWFVPQGLWYVTAESAGLTGNSNADLAATVKVSGVKANGKAVTNLLPVLPEQLDVNIPLTDKTAPVVQSVRYTDEGIYVTFSKYMVDTAKGADSVLNAANYALKTKDAAVVIGSVKAVEQGHTPANIDGKNVKTYTRTVLITPKTALKAGTEVLLTVKKAVKSYAGTAMTANYNDSGKLEAQKALGAPVIAGGAKQTVAFGSGVTVTLPNGAPDGAKIYYTTDGSAPTTASKLYVGPFAATNKMTVKAIAVCVGYKDSAVASADFTIDEALKYMPAGLVRTDGGDPAGITITLSGGGYKESVNVAADGSYVFHDVPVGSYTLSFDGNKDFRAASVKVDVTTFDPWVDLTLTDVNAKPDYTPGDVDGNGEIEVVDARYALRAAVGLEDYAPTSREFLAADTDCNQEIEVSDARNILRAAVGLDKPQDWKKAA